MQLVQDEAFDQLFRSFARSAFHLEVEDATTHVAPELLDAWAARPTVTGAFVRRLRDRLNAAEDEDERTRIARALRYGVYALEGDR